MKLLRIALVSIVGVFTLAFGVNQTNAEGYVAPPSVGPCYTQESFPEYKYSREISTPQSHQEYKYKQTVQDFKTKYQYQKQTRERTRYSTGSPWGSWSAWTWWSPPTFKSSFSNVEVLESGDHDGNPNDDWTTYDRDYQYVKNGVTEQVANGSHDEFSDWTTGSLTSPWTLIDTRTVQDAPIVTTEFYNNGDWTTDTPGAPWVQIDTRTSTRQGTAIACPKPADYDTVTEKSQWAFDCDDTWVERFWTLTRTTYHLEGLVWVPGEPVSYLQTESRDFTPEELAEKAQRCNPTTTAPTTLPPTTAPVTTVPVTTVPAIVTTVPVATVPDSTVPETTLPETTVPVTTVPESTVPASTVPAAVVPSTTTTVTPVVPPKTLPATGSNTGTYLLIGGLLVGAGLLLVGMQISSRRRRSV